MDVENKVNGSIASFYLETPFRISCRPVKQEEEYYKVEYECAKIIPKCLSILYHMLHTMQYGLFSYH